MNAVVTATKPDAVVLPPDIVGKDNAGKVQHAMAAAGAVLEHAAQISITDENSYTSAANLVQQVNTAIQNVEFERDQLIKPVKEQEKRLRDWFGPSVDKLKEAKSTIRRKMGEWADARSAREEAARQVAAAERRRNEAALQEIQAMQHQVSIADTGRTPYCVGRTVKGVDWLITETEKWEVSQEKFGALFDAATKTKAATLASLRSKRVEFEQEERSAAAAKLAKEAKTEQEREAAKEEQRKADMKRMREENQRMIAEAEHDEALTQEIAAATVPAAIEPPAPRTRVAGISEKKDWHVEILDRDKLPDIFWIVDEKAVAEFVRKNRDKSTAFLGDSCRVWSTTSVATGKK